MLSKNELDYIRPWVSIRLTAVLGGYNPTVIDAALDCIAKSLNRQSTAQKLSTYLEHETSSFVDDLYRKVLEVKSSNITKVVPGKRELKDNKEEDGPPAKRSKSRFDSPDTASPLSQSEVQAMLQSTRKQIEERKQQTQALVMGGVGRGGGGGLLPTPPGILPGQIGMVSDAVDKAKRAAELQSRIQSQLSSKPNLLANIKEKIPQLPSKPVPLVLDAEGKVELPMAVRQPTLKANIRAQQRTQFRQISLQHQKKDEEVEKNPYFDNRVALSNMGRNRKQFKFNEPGKFIKQGQTLRFKAQLEKLQSEIASSARKTGISSATKLALIGPSTEEREDDIPLVEWWDADLLPNRTYADCEREVPPEYKYREITNLVEHPIPVQTVGVPSKAVVIPVMLTKTERKKIRKQRRREAELEKQEKIRFGFLDKPEPKVRISNLMRVLGTEAVQDPTKITAHVKAQMAERQQKHEQANASRKLTAEQKRAKKIKKLQEDTSTGVHVTVYRVKDLSNQSNRFKVDMNAQQYHLTGCVLVHPGMNLVIVEGGPKGLKKYKRLMLHRMKWIPDKHRDDDDSDNEGDSNKKSKFCTVVWEGIRDERSFPDWRFKQCMSESLAREHLKRYRTEHYWDMALSESIVEQERD